MADELKAPWIDGRSDPVGWGIVGPGAIARVFADALCRSGAGTLRRVFGRSVERSTAFTHDCGGEVAPSLEDLLNDPEVEAVYIATPHPMHEHPVIASLDAEKAVLCEKPMTTSAMQTQRLIERSHAMNAPLAEAWMYRTHPQIMRLVELIRDGAIGRVQSVEACFGWAGGDHLPERLISPELGGGVILDIGGYPVSFVHLVARAAFGIDLPTPKVHGASGRLHTSGVELHTAANLIYPGFLTATVHASAIEALGIWATVTGDRGTIHVPCAFLPEGRRDGRRGELVLSNEHGEYREHTNAPHDCFALEARAVAEMSAKRQISPSWPMVDHSDSLSIACILDAWADALRVSTDRKGN